MLDNWQKFRASPKLRLDIINPLSTKFFTTKAKKSYYSTPSLVWTLANSNSTRKKILFTYRLNRSCELPNINVHSNVFDFSQIMYYPTKTCYDYGACIAIRWQTPIERNNSNYPMRAGRATQI